jgi:hypothetical protein
VAAGLGVALHVCHRAGESAGEPSFEAWKIIGLGGASDAGESEPKTVSVLLNSIFNPHVCIVTHSDGSLTWAIVAIF